MIGEILGILRMARSISNGEEITLQGIKDVNSKIVSRPNSDLIKRTNSTLAYFPLLMSNSISLKTAQLLRKAFEREYAVLIGYSMTDALVSLDSSEISRRGMNNSSSVRARALSLVHTNISTSTGSEYNEVKGEVLRRTNLDALTSESAKLSYAEKKEYIRLNEMNKALLATEEDDLNINCLSEARVHVEFCEDEDEDESYFLTNEFSNAVSDKEIKKENELTPSIINISVSYTDKDSKIRSMEIMQGVKAVIHLLKSNELTYFIPETIKKNKLIFTFIRWSTGEIKFWRDIVLQLDYAKKMVKNDGNMTSKWWRTLTNLSTITKYKKWLSKFGVYNKNDNLIPNATLIITDDEVEIIKRKYGIQVMSGASLKTIMDKMFLMRLVVVSESDEYITTIDSNGLQKYTFSSLEKENNNKNMLKDFLALTNKY